jgi:uncharacterized membrane protein
MRSETSSRTYSISTENTKCLSVEILVCCGIVRISLSRCSVIIKVTLLKAIKGVSAKFEASDSKRPSKTWFIHAMFLGYVIVLSTASLVRHYSFQTSAWDLGIFDQAVSSTLSGRLFYYTAELYANPGGSIFGVHFSPVLFLVVPFYVILRSPVTLLVIQSVVLGAGVYPVFLIGQHVLKDRRLAYYFSLLYLVYPHVYGINIFDFHPDAFFVPFALFALYFFMKGSWKPYLAFLLLGLSTKEFMAIVFAIFGLGELWIGRHEIADVFRSRSHPSKKMLMILGTMALSACWYLAARQVISVFNPNPPGGFAQGSPWSLLGFAPLDPSSWFHPGQINLLQAISYDSQSKLFYLFTIFAPLGFLPLFDLVGVLPALSWIVVALLSNYPPYYEIGLQYSALIAPFTIIAAIKGFGRVQSLLKTDSRRINKLVQRLFFACVLISLVLTFQNLPSSFQAIVSPHDQRLNNLIIKIQTDFPNASILTQYNLFPHISTSLESYVVPPLFPAFNKSYYSEYVESLFDMKPDFIILDLNPDTITDSLRKTYLYSYQNLERLSNEYGLYASSDGIFVYRHDYHGQPTVYEPYILTLKCNTHVDVNSVLFSLVFPRGTYQVTFEMKIPHLSSGSACIAQITQDNVILASQSLNGEYGYSPSLPQDFSLTINVTTSKSEVMFSILDPTTSADVYLQSIIVSMQTSH